MKITITGANSTVGLHLLMRLADEDDVDVAACVRSKAAYQSVFWENPWPRVTPWLVGYRDAEGLREAMRNADAVIHLAGILIEGRGTTYESANVATAEAVARAAAEAGAAHLLQVSVIGADTRSANRYFRTKGQAEDLFLASGVPATILRTPILLGEGTAGAAALGRTVRAGKARLLGGGTYTMRPLDADDLCAAILAVCRARPSVSSVHELVGPEPLTYRALVERAARTAGVPVSMGTTPIVLAKAGAWLRSRFKEGGVNPTVIDVITRDEVVERNADAELGITLTPLDVTLKKSLEAVLAT